MKPPSGGPITGPISAGMVSQASAEISSDFGTVRKMTSRPTGTIMAPPMPWMTRNRTKSPRPLRETAQRRAEREHDDGRAEHGARAEAVGHPAAQGNEHGERQEIRGQRQLERDRVLVQIGGDGRQRRRDHRRIHRLHEQGDGDDEGDEIAWHVAGVRGGL